MAEKKRLDQILVELGFYQSRERARTAIMSNYVKVAGQMVNKAGTQINTAKLEEPNYIIVEDKTMPYVSRGAYKIEKAAQEFEIDFKDKIVLDLGASTGGFTDYSLQNGAQKVFAVDVGKGQLDYKLRCDARIKNMEEKNVKELREDEIDSNIDIIVADLSFISIVKVLDNLKKIISNKDAQFIFLIKPQFEAGKKIADKFRGVISDDVIRQEIVDKVIGQIEEKGFITKGLVESPIKGAKGNVEFLAYFLLS